MTAQGLGVGFRAWAGAEGGEEGLQGWALPEAVLDGPLHLLSGSVTECDPVCLTLSLTILWPWVKGQVL